MANQFELFRVPEKIYFKKGSLPIALRELKEIYNRKKAFVIADSSLFKNDTVRQVTDLLTGMQLFYTDFRTDATLKENILSALEAIRKFEPDCIIGVGSIGMTVAKTARVLYENPEFSFDALAERTALRNDAVPVLKTGGKACLVCIAASGAVDELSPRAFLYQKGGKQSSEIQDYSLLPDMTVIDTDLISDETLIFHTCKASFLAALAVYGSSDASDYAQGLALKAVQLIFRYLPAYKQNADDLYAVERLSNAAAMAEMALSNVSADGTAQTGGESALTNALGMTAEEFRTKAQEITNIF